MRMMPGLARRIHIAGSASKQCSPEKLRYAHEVVRGFTRAHSLSGGSLLVQVAEEEVTPASLRGKAVLITFVDTKCVDKCPL
jgi:cytochrome oxidase Cu insertion factor (SCO1/SenC/PrrC family)